MTPATPVTPANPANPLALTPPPVTSVIQHMQKMHDLAGGLFSRTSEGMAHVNQMQAQLSSLAKLGDAVLPEDVIKTTGKLIASGSFTPQQAASVLSDMPQGGMALANWIQTHLVQTNQVAQQMQITHAIARHELGVSAIRALQAQSGQQGPLNGATAPSQVEGNENAS